MRRKIGLVVKILSILIGVFLIGFVALVILVYNKQETVVKQLLQEVNQQIPGKLSIEQSKINIVENFPYISIDLKETRLFENKQDTCSILVINDFYVGFDLMDLIYGRFIIKKVKIESGKLSLVADSSGVYNVEKALIKNDLSNEKSQETSPSPFFKLKDLSVSNFVIHKNAPQDLLDLTVKIEKLSSSIKRNDTILKVNLQTELKLDLQSEGKVWAQNKPIQLKTKFEFDELNKIIELEPTQLMLADAEFKANGNIDLDNDLDLNINLSGKKNDFSLLVNLLPDDLILFMNRFKNAGSIYFDAEIKGKSIHGNQPAINARFGCSNGFFKNVAASKTLDALNFEGRFTNGRLRNASTSKFSLKNFSAKPEQGKILASLIFRNFDDPYVDLKVNTDFELQFLADFLQLQSIQNLTGRVILNVDYNELVDFTDASILLSKIKKEVKSQLSVSNLSFQFPGYPHRFENINAHAEMEGGKLILSNLSMKVKGSDIRLKGYLSDLPALFHGFDKPIDAKINLTSNSLDFDELTASLAKPEWRIKEKLSQFSTSLSMLTNAAEWKSSKNWPKGLFSIDSLSGKLKYYPHTINKFSCSVEIGNQDIELKKLDLTIDSTDLRVQAKLNNYKKWLQENKEGRSEIHYKISSNHVYPSNLLTYKNQLYWPEEYRNEHIEKLALHGKVAFNHANDTLQSFDLIFHQASAKLSVHPLKLYALTGSIHAENNELSTKDLKMQLGNSDLKLNMNYYYGKKPAAKLNSFVLQSNLLDFDQLTNYDKHKVSHDTSVDEHAKAFNIFELPVNKYDIKMNLGKLTYHKIKIEQFASRIYSKEKGIIVIDNMSMKIDESQLRFKGKLNGTNPKKIYLIPEITLSKLDLNKVLIKADNFGQQYIVNENIKGVLSGQIDGKIKLHPDFFPIVDESSLTMNLQLENGALINYGPMSQLSSFFGEKNLNYVRFDTLRNTFKLENNRLSVPAMTINSSLGFIEVSGSQKLSNNEMDYVLKIPLSLVSQLGVNKLFGRKNRDDIPEDQMDEIVRREDQKRVRFVSVKIAGTSDNMKIGLAKRNGNK